MAAQVEVITANQTLQAQCSRSHQQQQQQQRENEKLIESREAN